MYFVVVVVGFCLPSQGYFVFRFVVIEYIVA
jgi:hypothetical protein